MQNAAFAALALDYAYVPLDVPPERLEDALRVSSRSASPART